MVCNTAILGLWLKPVLGENLRMFYLGLKKGWKVQGGLNGRDATGFCSCGLERVWLGPSHLQTNSWMWAGVAGNISK